MQPSQACIGLIQEFEGCAKKQLDGPILAYPDPGTGGDPWTIGWGSTGPAAGKMMPGLTRRRTAEAALYAG